MRPGPTPEVEEVQDIVERVLLDSPYYKTAKAYILYREQHAQIRQLTTTFNVDLVDQYIQKTDWKIKENSNMSYSLQGLNNYISSDVTAEYWLNSIYPPEIRNAHKEGDIHIHDLSLLSVYCVGWDLQDLLRQGFKGVEGKVESSPPKHLRSALGQIVNFFYTLQGEAAGAQAISNFDTLLAPFVRYDQLDYKDVKQALQEFIFNINLPRIGYASKIKSEFYSYLIERIQLAVESLSIKRKVLEKFTKNHLYPYSKFYLRDVKNGTGSYWKNHFSTIGIIGMNEACLNFIGEDITTEHGQQFSMEVMDFIRDTLSKVQEETGEIFNLEATPAEGTSYRLSMLDKKKFPEIICANEADYGKGAAPYYTNSSQLPVNYTDDIFETLSLQDELQTKYTGGTVLHIFLGEHVDDMDALKGLIRKIATNYRLPYFTLTPTFSICPSHGYLDGEQETCSICDQKTEVYSRVVGYLRPVKQWNEGKQAEFGNRRSFKVAS
jgi:anaerobic ribonucleoside-triphosphate reductase